MRQSGFYWVKLSPEEWVVARWNKIYWVIPICAEDYYIETRVFYDKELIEIDEVQITRPIKSNITMSITPSKDFDL